MHRDVFLFRVNLFSKHAQTCGCDGPSIMHRIAGSTLRYIVSQTTCPNSGADGTAQGLLQKIERKTQIFVPSLGLCSDSCSLTRTYRTPKQSLETGRCTPGCLDRKHSQFFVIGSAYDCILRVLATLRQVFWPHPTFWPTVTRRLARRNTSRNTHRNLHAIATIVGWFITILYW